VLWYGDYSRGYLGRFDPKTGAVREWPSPGGPRSQPYGITTLKEIVWYSESAVSPTEIAFLWSNSTTTSDHNRDEFELIENRYN